MNLIAGNPLIERYRYSSLRPKQCWIYVSIFVMVIAIALGINYSILKNHPDLIGDVHKMCASLYYQFAAFLIFISWIIAGGSSSTAISSEITDRSYDFFRMLPLSAHQKAIGILIGRNLLLLIFCAILIATITALGFIGGIPLRLQTQMLTATICAALFFNCAALFTSINPSRKTQNRNNSTIGLLFAAIFLLPYMIALIFSLSEVKAMEDILIPFFFLEIPLLNIISILALFFCGWIYAGIIRKFDREAEPVMTRRAAILFLTGIIFIVTGLAGPHINQPAMQAADDNWVVLLVWFIPFMFILAMPFGFFQNRERYLELMGLNKTKDQAVFLAKKSNLATCLLLFAVWAAAAIGIRIYAGNDITQALLHIAVLFSFYAVFSLLYEVYALTVSGNTKLTALLVFLGIVYLILPLIIGAIIQSGQISALSLFGTFGLIAAKAIKQPFDGNTNIVMLANALWITVLAGVLRTSYRRLLAARANMAQASDDDEAEAFRN